MKLTTNNKDPFRYYLSACVSALRSVTFFMQKEYAHTANFSSWYDEKQTQLKADKISAFFTAVDRSLDPIHETRSSVLARTKIPQER